MRTNIDIDDELIDQAMRRFGFRTKREAVNFALDELLRRERCKRILKFRASGCWEGDLAALREARSGDPR